jgi:putative transposase
LASCVDGHRELYNAALQERRDAWAHSKTGINYGDQSAQLSEIRSMRPDQARWSFSSQQATLRRLNKAFAGFFGRVKAGQTPGYPRFKGNARFDSVQWPKDGDGARWLPDQRRVYLQGVGQVKVHLHRRVEGIVKTVQVKRQGRRWMLVLSCDDVPTKPLPATGGQAGIDVGVVTYATLSDGTAVANPRWARQQAGRLEVAQQRLQRAKRGSNNRVARRETVAALHRKIANRRKDFHHKQARELAVRYDLLVVEDLKIANMLRRAKPKPDPDTRNSSSPMVPGPSPGSTDRSVTLAGASSSRYCAPKRKTLGAPGSRSTPGTPLMGVSAAVTQRPRTASPKRNSSANAAVTPHRQTNTPHATSSGLDWPYTPHMQRKRSRRLPAVGEVTTKSPTYSSPAPAGNVDIV